MPRLTQFSAAAVFIGQKCTNQPAGPIADKHQVPEQ
jgi:hypothetical protein